MIESKHHNTAMVGWRCRRGMLELDRVLLPFFEQHYAGLSDEDKEHFIDLLQATDPELNHWLLQGGQPEKAEHRSIVHKILTMPGF